VLRAAFLGALLAGQASAGVPTGWACEPVAGPEAPDWVPVCIRPDRIEADICTAIEVFALGHGLPPGFLARLIWQESLFDPGALSWKGAQGIAQFMPGTADLRGLRNPWNPAEALSAAAAYLAELSARFGSLGLAAAAYNGGENRVEGLLAGTRTRMPAETEDYVMVITGRSIAEWREGRAGEPDFGLEEGRPFAEACLALATSRELKRELSPGGAWKPWGVHLGSHFSRSVAQRYFRLLKARYPSLLGAEQALIVRDRKLSRGPRARYALRIGRDSRREAYLLCGRLRSLGGVCTIARN
jgi:hypothetical protein